MRVNLKTNAYLHVVYNVPLITEI